MTKSTEVTKAVTELLGLDQKQFRQIAMIAQGDFQKLLLAETADRSEIFRKMFHTEIYQELQNRLRDAAKERSNTYSEKRRSILQYLDNIVCPEGTAGMVPLPMVSNSSLAHPANARAKAGIKKLFIFILIKHLH